MDNLVSMKEYGRNRDKGWSQMAADIGANGLCMKGPGTSSIMIGTLAGFPCTGRTDLSKMPFISALSSELRQVQKLQGRNVESLGVVPFIA
jgi:hypothetical protein